MTLGHREATLAQIAAGCSMTTEDARRVVSGMLAAGTLGEVPGLWIGAGARYRRN